MTVKKIESYEYVHFNFSYYKGGMSQKKLQTEFWAQKSGPSGPNILKNMTRGRLISLSLSLQPKIYVT